MFTLMVILASAWSQAGAEQAATEQASPGQALTLAELEGAEIQVKIVRHQMVRREGREFPVTVHNDWKLILRPGGMIEQTHDSTAHTPRGPRRAETLTGSFLVDHVRDVQSAGGGRAVWQFNEGTLTFLRTFKSGALKTTVALARGAEGLTCTANETFAREKGSGRIELKSRVDDAPITILSWKPVSSDCRVTKR
jgi:hypothetical protein